LFKKIWRVSCSRINLVRVESVVGFPDFPVFVASGSIDARGGAQLIDCKSHRAGANVAVDFGVLVVDVDLFDLIEKLLLLNLARNRKYSTFTN